MIIISGESEIEYGTTPGGQFFEKHTIGKGVGIVRITPDPERFLRWMIQSEVNEEFENKHREYLCNILAEWWPMKNFNTFRGSFNKELYLKIIQAKKNNGTLHK